jgi:hypothetical protein
MASVYEGATITIVASWGQNGRDGCFHPMHPTLTIECQDTSVANSSVRLRLRPKPDQYTYLGSAPLNTRAWTFQEVILSRRALVFTEDQMYWQCTSLLESEDGIEHVDQLLGIETSLPPLGLAIRQPDLSSYKLYYHWLVATQRYSHRKLTFASDKLAALAGITQMFQRVTQDEPLAGLWKKDLQRGLLWSTPPSSHGERDLEAIRALNLPSWSWLSSKTPIEHRVPSRLFSGLAEIAQAQVSWTDILLISKIQHASILGKGKLLRVVDLTLHDNKDACTCRAKESVTFETRDGDIFLPPINSHFGLTNARPKFPIRSGVYSFVMTSARIDVVEIRNICPC